MDCNKDEAIRAKEIALRKFSEKDVIGAAKFAVKAQKLYPELEGISHLVANFDLHMSAKYSRNGEIDWYRMLGVSPSADSETISKQYRKMALLIHPDKNREVGSESAFKLLSEAFRVLKDTTTRSAYDLRINIQPVRKNVPANSTFVHVPPTFSTQTGFPSAATDWSQFIKKGVGTQSTHSGAQPSWNCSAPPNYCPPHQKGPTSSGFSGVPPRPVNRKVQKSGHDMVSSTATRNHQERNSFWTSCTGCKMKFEYLLMFHNQYLCCPSCETAFQATEIPIPSMWLNTDKSFSFSRSQNQKSSQIDGSSVVTNSSHAGMGSALSSLTTASHIMHPSPSGAPHAADKGKPSKKRSKQGYNAGDVNGKSKRQKSNDNLTKKPTVINNGRTGITFL